MTRFEFSPSSALTLFTLLFLSGCGSSRPASEGFMEAALSPATADLRSDAELKWETRPTGVSVAVLYGDPDQPGPFGLRLRYPPGYAKAPHYHPNDATVTVLSGSYYRSYTTNSDRSEAVHLTGGTFSLNPAGVSHHEWVEEGAELEVHAVGPWGTVYVHDDGEPVDPGRRPAVSPQARPPVVLAPEDLEWRVRPDGDEVSVLYGDPDESGPFVLRIRSVAGTREAPHHHPRDAFVTVLSGSFQYAAADAEAQTVTVGNLLRIPAGTRHFKWNESPSIVELHAVGPWSKNEVQR